MTKYPTRTSLFWWMSHTALVFACMAIGGFLVGCGGPKKNEVVVYCALDREFSEPILQEFEKETGIAVRAKYDVESTKSVGLANQILKEKDRPRCDVFWNNEALHTVRLAHEGAIVPTHSEVGMQYPPDVRPSDGSWYAFAARVRVLLINTTLVEEAVIPKTSQDLLLPRWRNQIGIAKPLFGTTATHAACLFSVLGEAKAKDFFHRLKENEVRILSGNKQVAVDVGAGKLAMGLTDTDDALGELNAKKPVRLVYLDAESDGWGILVIPNTISVVKGGPNPGAAKKLLDFVLSPKVEATLALGPSGQIPLHPSTSAAPGLGVPANARRMPIDWRKVSEQWEPAMKFIRDEFSGP